MVIYGDEQNNTIEIFFQNKGVVDQETYYKLSEKETFCVSRVSRGEEKLLLTFNDKKIALLYMVILVKVSKLYFNDNDGDQIYYSITQENAEEVLAKYLNAKYYSLLSEKKETISLLKENEVYNVYYIDNRGNKRMLNSDNPDIQLGASVLFNYAREYMLLEEELNSWGFDKEVSPEIEKIYAKILGYES